MFARKHFVSQGKLFLNPFKIRYQSFLFSYFMGNTKVKTVPVPSLVISISASS